MYVLSAIGFLAALYLTLVHYAGVPLECSTSGLINCANVINSPYGYLFGIPVALLGVVFFILEFAVLFVTSSKRFGALERTGSDIRILYNALGLAFVFYLLYAEYIVGNICEYCTVVHVVTVLLFILSFFGFEEKKLEYYSQEGKY